jgi:hypothetical protein
VASSLVSHIKNTLGLEPSLRHGLDSTVSKTSAPAFTSSLDQLKETSQELLHGLLALTYTAKNTPISELYAELSNPTTLTTALCLLSLFAYILMSWSTRFGWGGRFSPFGRSNSPAGNGAEVSDADFSYITSEDLATHARHTHARPEIVDWDDKDPDRDTDLILLKHRRVSYPTHFPAHSIANGDLKIGSVRAAAAKKLGVADARRIRLFYRGRNMKHDERAAREEGLRGDGAGSEVLCVVGEAVQGSMAPGAEQADELSWSVGSEEEDTEDLGDESGRDGSVTHGGKKKRSRGGRKRKGRRDAPSSAAASSSNLASSTSTTANAEFLPVPSSIPAPRPTSAPPAGAGAGAGGPQTALQKLDAIASNFHMTLVPMCVSFSANPPTEKAKRDFEHKKLTETILAQVLIKLDSVDTGGDDEARGRRKELVKEAQGVLNRLDEVVK